MAADVTVDLSQFEDLETALDNAGEDILRHLENDAGALIREVMSTHAKNLAAVDTGTMRQMIDSDGAGDARRDGDAVEITITAHADYSMFVEYGTGFRGDPRVPHTSKKTWFQLNPDYNPIYGEGDPRSRKWIQRYPQRPQPFMEPAVKMSIPQAKKIIAGQVEEVFDL